MIVYPYYGWYYNIYFIEIVNLMLVFYILDLMLLIKKTIVYKSVPMINVMFIQITQKL